MMRNLLGLGLLIGVFTLTGCGVPLPLLVTAPAEHTPDQRFEGSWFEGEILLGYEDEQALSAITHKIRGRVLELIPQIRAALIQLPANLDVKSAVVRLIRERPAGLRYAEPNYIRNLIAPQPAWPDPREVIAQDANSAQLRSFNDPLRPRQWALDRMRIERAWERATGKGVIIGIVDTGMDGTHPELKGKQLPGMDCLTGKIHPADFDSSQNEEAHATHVAGIAAAWGNNGEGIIGVAPDARIMIVQIFNASIARPNNPSGYVGDAKVAKCLLWATSVGPDGVENSGDEADVLNNSWGGRGYGQTLKDAIDKVLEHEAVFVNSMGNSSEDEVLYPKGYPGVLAVGATTPKDEKTSFSTMGHQISVGAPGEDVISSVPLWLKRPTDEPYGYQYFSGTSMAAPQVAGAIALLKELFPEATPYQLQKILERTADDIEQPGFDRRTGWGRINLAKALRTSRLPEDGAHVVIRVLTHNRADTNKDGTINGFDEQLGLPFVDVLLRNSQGIDKYFVQTDAQGFARFFNIEPGDYEIRVGGGDVMIYGFRTANRITQRGRVRALSGQTAELTMEFNTTLKVTIFWSESVDVDLLIGEPQPGGDIVWASSKTGARWGEFRPEGNRETYVLSQTHYPDAVYPLALSAEHASAPATVTVVLEQNGIPESYGPFVLQPGQVLPSLEWYDWWENFPDEEKGFEEPGPGGPWVY